jgi:hypothetical protein
MADERDVLINFVGKTDELQPVENVLTDIVEKAGDVGTAWKKASEKMTTDTKTSVESTNKLAKSIEALAVATKSMDKAVVGGAYKQYLKDIQSQLGLTSKELIAYIQNARKAAQTAILLAGSDEDINELNISIEVMNDQLKELGVNMDESSEKSQSFLAKIRELTDGLKNAKAAGMEGSDEYERMREELVSLQKQSNDTNKELKVLGSDTKSIDGLISLASGVAGGFAIAQGTMALFGSENEEVQKALLKVNAAMAILQGLQTVQNVLQKESAASLLFGNTQRTAAVATTAAQTVATEGAVVAQTKLNTAMSLNPVGLIILGITALITVMSLFDDSAEDSTKAVEHWTSALNFLNDALADLNRFNASQMDKEIAGLQKKNALQSEIQKSQIKGLGQSLEAELQNANQINNLYQQFRDDAAAGKFTKEDFKKQNDEFFKQQQQSGQNISKLRSDLSVAEINLAKQTQDEILQSQTSAAQANLARKKLIIINNQVDEISAIKAVSDAEIDAIRARANEELKSKANTPGDVSRIYAERNLAIAEKEKDLQIKLLQIGKAGINARLLLDQKGTEQEFDDKLALLKQQEKIELAAADLTASQILEIKNNYRAQELELIRKFEEQKISNEISYLSSYLDEFGITEERKLELTIRRIDRQRDLEISQAEGNAAKIKEINAKYDKEILASKKAMIAAVLAEQIRSFNAYTAIQDAQANRTIAADRSSLDQRIMASELILNHELYVLSLEETALKAQKAKNLITQKDYDVQVKEINNKRTAATIANEERITAATNKEIEKRVAKLQAVFSLFQKGLQATIGSGTFTVLTTELMNFALTAESTLEKLKAKTITNIEAIKALASAAIAATQSVVNQIFADASASRQRILADELAALEEAKQKELSVQNITMQQKADIETRFRNEERRLKIQAFNADKEAKKSQALINGALAVTLAFASYAWPYNLIVAGLMASLTGIEIAEINRQQPPRFKTGKVDIQGPGTGTSDSIDAKISKGESVITADATKKWKGALEAMNAGSFDHYMMKQFKDFVFPQVPGDINVTAGGPEIDYNKLAKAMAAELKEVIPEPRNLSLIADADGLRTYLQEGNSKTEILNKRYSMS